MASDAVMVEAFGSSVSIANDTAVIGAFRDDSEAGSAYVYVEPDTGWNNAKFETTKLTASDRAASDWFGYSVSIAKDTVLVGAYTDDYDGKDGAGSAYIFVEPDSVNGWEDFNTGVDFETAKLIPLDVAADDRFGFAVAIYKDLALISSNLDDDGYYNSGSAYIFTRPDTASGWEDFITGTTGPTAKLTASDAAANMIFGDAVALSEDVALIGA